MLPGQGRARPGCCTHRLLLGQPGPPSRGLGLELRVPGAARPSEARGAAGERFEVHAPQLLRGFCESFLSCPQI